MKIDDIKLKDIMTRTNILKKYSLKKSKDLIGSGSLLANKAEKQNIKSQLKNNSKEKFALSEETDEEDWIKANIIKIEAGEVRKTPHILKTKTSDGNIVINRKRANVDSEPSRAGKKIIINSGGVLKTAFITKSNQIATSKIIPSTSSLEEQELKSAENPELKYSKQNCFLSLIRNIFCSTPDHRMKLEELRRRVNAWLKHPIASENVWFKEVSNAQWSNLLISAVHFLSGEFSDQPEGFVPYLEFKSHLNIYQWIGAGRDADHRMINLNQYWLSRQNDMGIRNKTKLKNISIPENNEENFLMSSVMPSRCQTDWKVRAASKEEIIHFQLQEKKRFETPFKSFVYREHDYESVVGPVRNIPLTQSSIAKTRDNNLLKNERPGVVTTT